MNQLPNIQAGYGQAAQDYIAGLPLGDGDWLLRQRQTALERFYELGFPDRRQEAWRYTSVEGLLEQEFSVSDKPAPFAPHAVIREFLADQTSGRLVFVDGVYQPGLSNTEIPGVRVGNLRGAMAAAERQTLRSVGSLSGTGEHAFSAFNLATLQDGAVISVSAGRQLEQPLELLHVSTGRGGGRSNRLRHMVQLESGASATLVERYLSLDENIYFNNLVCEITLADGASLRHQRVQQESLQSYHLAEIYLQLGENAHYQGVSAALGGAWSRTTLRNRFTAAGAVCELDGLYLAGEGQLVDYHLDIDHAVPGCASRENFKGILNGRSRAVFDGRILVQQQAQKTSAHLSNANLLLSRNAEIDTKPQLEIFADDVQCSHGTTVGQLDADAMFYLRSRGMSEALARRMLCLGFANDVLELFDSDSLREQLAGLIRTRLEETQDVRA